MSDSGSILECFNCGYLDNEKILSMMICARCPKNRRIFCQYHCHHHESINISIFPKDCTPDYESEVYELANRLNLNIGLCNDHGIEFDNEFRTNL